MSKLTFSVRWEGPEGLTYQQDFENIDEARIALVMHRERNAVLSIGKQV